VVTGLPEDWGHSTFDLKPGQLRQVNVMGFGRATAHGPPGGLQLGELLLILGWESTGHGSDGWWILSNDRKKQFPVRPEFVISWTDPVPTAGDVVQ
jgi:hypothetical protein